jgi:hypothetical protein
MRHRRTAGLLLSWTPALTLLTACATLAAQTAGLAGVWRGESICVQQGTACNNEQVVYYIDAIPNHLDQVQIRADKIVNGKAVTMGSGPWAFDADHQTLKWETPHQVWLLAIHGPRMQGTLTLSDGTLVRKMTLQKE